MMLLYTNENFPLPAVHALRALGYDVLTSFDAGKANQAIPDEEVLDFAREQSRVLLTLNRKHFVKLHKEGDHKGIIVCTFNPDFNELANAIDKAVQENRPVTGKLLRINRPMK